MNKKTKKTTMLIRTQKGFSLVELMVVVGIIGLLAAIAVPQFAKFQARARQSEAKALLSTIFTAEKTFFSEWNGYTASMSNAGAGMTGNKLRYDGRVGAGAACTGTYPAGAPGDASVTVFAASTGAAYDGGCTTPAGTGGACDNGATRTFTGSVYGNPNNNIPAAGAAMTTPDTWTITDTKIITNTANGIQ